MNKRMLSKIINKEIDNILKILFKNDFFSESSIHSFEEYINTNFRSYDEIVMESYKNYIRNKINNELNMCENLHQEE